VSSNSSKLLILVVTTLLLACSVFAVVGLIANDQVLAEGITASPSGSPSATPESEASPTQVPSPTPTESATPTPVPSPTIDPTAVILDITKYRATALKVEKRVKKARTELAKRRAAFGRPTLKALKGRRDFTTWKDTLHYYRLVLKDVRQKNRDLWRVMVQPGGSGVVRWIPLLHYCGLPESMLGHALQVMDRESHGNRWAKNKSSTASGLYQFLASWWRGKWDPFNAYENVRHFVKAVLGPSGWSPWALTA
jgi:hypothetical protein